MPEETNNQEIKTQPAKAVKGASQTQAPQPKTLEQSVSVQQVQSPAETARITTTFHVDNGAAAEQAAAPKLSFLAKLLNKDKNSESEAKTNNNVFTKLFGKVQLFNPAAKAGERAKAQAEMQARTNVQGQAQAQGQVQVKPVAPEITGVKVDTAGFPQALQSKLSMLLGPKPQFDPAQQEQAERRHLKIAKTVFKLALVCAILTYGFFYTQLNPDFTFFTEQLGPNTAVEFERSNSELQKTQTDINLVRFRIARLWLDEANSNIDAFQRQTAIVNSEFIAGAQKQEALAELQVLGATIKNALSEVQKLFAKPIGIDIYSKEPVSPQQREEIFTALLTEELLRQRSAFADENQPNQEEIRIIDNVLRLVENKRFRNAVLAQDLGKISEEDFSGMLAGIREEATDELSAIDKIRRSRVNWGEIIQDIRGVTQKADLYYGQGLFKTVGGFLFNSYRFDAAEGRVSISGITKTADSKTFSFIAKLVDTIEKSPKFKDIDFRSFSKNRDETGDYSSSINLEFTLQPKGETDSRDDIFQSK